jgi:tRNA threonylcarbamoyladenosine biosynthesis protein TsaB
MRLLALETSGDPASIALVVDGEVQAECSFPSRTALCRSLPERLQWVLGGPPTPGSLDALAVSLGPGSFTGLRVGVALVKALAQVLQVPLVGVPTHEAVAARVPCEGGALWVIQHARETDLYATAFHASDGAWVAEGPCRVVSVAALGAKLAAEARGPAACGRGTPCPSQEEGGPAMIAPRAIQGRGTPCPSLERGRPPLRASEHNPVRLVGEGLERHGEALRAVAPEALQMAPELWLPTAASVGLLAYGRVAQADPDAVWSLRPIYVLASQAERAQGVDLGLS